MKRRTFLAAAGAAVPLAGCTSVTGSNGDDATCSADERYTIVDVVETDQLEGFTMSVDPAEVQHGERLTVRMENASDEEQLSGNRRKFTIHRRVDGEWQSVYTEGEHSEWNDIGIQHEPGEGFTWELSVSQDGFSEAPNRLEACAAVEPGDYRFVYWGVGTEKEEATDWEKEYGLGAEFAVVE